jgi:K+-transporting ATPase KdpF subunit
MNALTLLGLVFAALLLLYLFVALFLPEKLG